MKRSTLSLTFASSSLPSGFWCLKNSSSASVLGKGQNPHGFLDSLFMASFVGTSTVVPSFLDCKRADCMDMSRVLCVERRLTTAATSLAYSHHTATSLALVKTSAKE